MKTRLLLLFIAALLPAMTLKAQKMENKKVLVAYYSRSGNTKALATMIQEITGADLFEIVPRKAYPADYDACTEQAKKEINAGVKPALETKVLDMGKYDTVIIGSPYWWSAIAPPVATFLSSYDFSGKTLLPFMTHGGSGMGHSEADIKKLCPQAELLKGLPVYGSSVGNARKQVTEWLRKYYAVRE